MTREPVPLSGTTTLAPALADIPGHLFWRANARVNATLATVLPAGVEIRAYAVLVALADAVPRSQQEIAALIMVSRTTMARLAEELVAQGLVDRIRNPQDRRSYALTRTPLGEATAARWSSYADDLSDAFRAGFSPGEQRDLLELLNLMVAEDLPPSVLPQVHQSTAFLIARIHARMHRSFLEALEPVDLEPRDYGSLRVLDGSGPITQAGLARSLGVTQPPVVEIVDRLEERGFLERRASPTDRRTNLLHLLPAGRAAVRKATRAEGALRDQYLAPLSPDQRRRLVELLQRFVLAA